MGIGIIFFRRNDMKIRYRIYELSAKAIMSYAQAVGEDKWVFDLDRKATRHCVIWDAPDEQDDSALFFQTMCALRGSEYEQPADGTVVEDLSDIIVYVSFSDIFEHMSGQKKYTVRQRKAECMFSDDGIVLDMGGGQHRYLPFERSGSMSRKATLSFIRSDLYEPVRERIMLGMKIGMCQLSKLYAYNGLMLSGGVRVDGLDLSGPHRVVVVENEVYETSVTAITAEGVSVGESAKKYTRVEKAMGLKILRHDGEGVISKEYSQQIDRSLCKAKLHTSFQIRMPFVKGMLHEIDFKKFYKAIGVTEIADSTLNSCVNRNYMYDKDERHTDYGSPVRQGAPSIYMNYPLLHIPAEEPRLSPASAR